MASLRRFPFFLGICPFFLSLLFFVPALSTFLTSMTLIYILLSAVSIRRPGWSTRTFHMADLGMGRFQKIYWFALRTLLSLSLLQILSGFASEDAQGCFSSNMPFRSNVFLRRQHGTMQLKKKNQGETVLWGGNVRLQYDPKPSLCTAPDDALPSAGIIMAVA